MIEAEGVLPPVLRCMVDPQNLYGSVLKTVDGYIRHRRKQKLASSLYPPGTAPVRSLSQRLNRVIP
jgi:hypothetical protein